MNRGAWQATVHGVRHDWAHTSANIHYTISRNTTGLFQKFPEWVPELLILKSTQRSNGSGQPEDPVKNYALFQAWVPKLSYYPSASIFLIWCDANFVHMFCITRRESFVSLEESFPGGTEVKNPPANAGDIRDTSSIPGSERPPGEGHGNPLQCSCLESPMDRGGWWATVHGVAK